MNSSAVFAIGFLAQIFFSARILVQWLLSERAGKVLSPTPFWILSLAGSYLFCLYGVLRSDFAIVLGQFISYYVYLWNLDKKGVFRKIKAFFRALLILTPLAALLFVLHDAGAFLTKFFRNEDIPMGLILFGSSGQILFTLRFVYQFFDSRRKDDSVLSDGFWWISLAGSSVIVTYGIIRLDPVLIVGQSFGLAAYIRNLWIGARTKTRTRKRKE